MVNFSRDNFLRFWSLLCRLFVDRKKVTSQVETHLKVNSCPSKKELCVQLKPYKAITEEVKRLAEKAHAKIWVSPMSAFPTHFVCLITTGRFQSNLHVRLCFSVVDSTRT